MIEIPKTMENNARATGTVVPITPEIAGLTSAAIEVVRVDKNSATIRIY